MSDSTRARTPVVALMRRRWAIRTALAFAAWVAFAGVLTLGDVDVRMELLATLVAAIATCTWLTIDLEARTAPADWELIGTAPTRARGEDQRMSRIQRQLKAHVETRRSIGTFHTTIVELVDDRMASHGVDRLTDPERYEQLVGPEIASFVFSPPDAIRLRSPDAIAQLITRIETL